MRPHLLAFCLLIALLRSSVGQNASPSPTPSPSPARLVPNGLTPHPPGQLVGKTKDGEPIYSVGSDIKFPRVTYQPEPDYSRQARKKKIRGVVVIQGYVGTDGKFHDAKITRPLDPLVDPDALAGVSRWQFNPTTKDGKPINCQIYIEINIHLQ